MIDEMKPLERIRRQKIVVCKPQRARYTDPCFTWDMWRALEAWWQNKATNTAKQYRRTLDHFCEVFGIDQSESGKRLIASVGPQHVTQYISVVQTLPAQPGRPSLVSDRVSLVTVRHKVNILCSIWEHLLSLEHVQRNPWKATQRTFRGKAEDQRRPHRALPQDKVRELFSLRFRGSEGKRDRAILAAQFGGALRPSEALGLRLSDIKTTPKGATALLLRHTKAQRAELQVIPAWAAEFITSYLEIRKIEGAKPSDHLFVRYVGGKSTNKPVIDRTWRNWFKRYMLEVDLDPDYSPHDARATAITTLRKRGHTYEEIRLFSRHSSVTMVQQYDKFLGHESEELAEKLKY